MESNESNTNRSIVVEFNGLPGTGKSTITNALGHLLQKKGISYCNNYSRDFISRNAYTSFLDISCRRLGKLLRRYESSYPHVENLRHRNRYVNQIFRSYIGFIKLNNGVLIKDQGLIQALLSIPHTESINNEAILVDIASFLRENGIYFLRVDCKTDVNLSVERVSERPTMSARLDNVPLEELSTALKQQANNLHVIRSIFDSIYSGDNEYVIKIDTSLPPEKNAYIVLQRILTLRCIANTNKA